MWREDAANGQVGATWTGEFLPLTVTEQRWALGRPLEGARDGRPLPGARSVSDRELGYQALDVRIDSSARLPVRLHQFYLPGWTASLNGAAAPTYPSGELGLVTVDVPAGQHRVVVTLWAATARTMVPCLPLRRALGWPWPGWRTVVDAGGCVRAAGVVLVIGTVALVLNRVGLGSAPGPRSRPMPPSRTWPCCWDTTSRRRAGRMRSTSPSTGSLCVTSARTTRLLSTLLGPDGQAIAQHDGDPGGGFTPTTRWRQGEIVPDRHRVPLPPGMAPGSYAIKAGLYQYEPLRNLAVDPPSADGRVDLGVVTLPLR